MWLVATQHLPLWSLCSDANALFLDMIPPTIEACSYSMRLPHLHLETTMWFLQVHVKLPFAVVSR